MGVLSNTHGLNFQNNRLEKQLSRMWANCLKYYFTTNVNILQVGVNKAATYPFEYLKF